ncbi:GNAT family N-acetyltransferase [Opitutaceae bacterium]
MNPILLDFPSEFTTARLLLRAPRAGDGAAVNAAIRESHAELRPWMPWARTLPTREESEIYMREKAAHFALRTDLVFQLFLRSTSEFIGATGLHRMDWTVPRFEIGYWLRTSRSGEGYMSEAVRGLTDFAATHLRARRIEIRMDSDNGPSRRVAERSGYPLEAILYNDRRNLDGELVHSCIYTLTFDP